MDSIGLSRQIKITSIIGRVPSDDELAIRARSLLRWKIRYNSIHVEAENGHLILSGEVDSSSDRDAAEQTIRRLRGVVGVTNRISASEDCKPQVHECLQQSSRNLSLRDHIGGSND